MLSGRAPLLHDCVVQRSKKAARARNAMIGRRSFFQGIFATLVAKASSLKFAPLPWGARQREDLEDLICELEPLDTPFLRLAARTESE